MGGEGGTAVQQYNSTTVKRYSGTAVQQCPEGSTSLGNVRYGGGQGGGKGFRQNKIRLPVGERANATPKLTAKRLRRQSFNSLYFQKTSQRGVGGVFTLKGIPRYRQGGQNAL